MALVIQSRIQFTFADPFVYVPYPPMTVLFNERLDCLLSILKSKIPLKMSLHKVALSFRIRVQNCEFYTIQTSNSVFSMLWQKPLGIESSFLATRKLCGDLIAIWNYIAAFDIFCPIFREILFSEDFPFSEQISVSRKLPFDIHKIQFHILSKWFVWNSYRFRMHRAKIRYDRIKCVIEIA